MLFGKKKCTHCESEYDVVLDTCPACKAPYDGEKVIKKNEKILWLPLIKQILLFAVGWLGLEILSLIGQLIGYLFIEQDTVHFYMFVNGFRYLITFVGMIFIIGNSFPSFKKHINRAFPWLIGLAGGAAMLTADIVYGNIINLFYQATENQNQAVANTMVSTYPILCILLLGIIGPVVEEFTYRVGLFSFFCRINKYLAYAVTIVIFSLIHFNFFAVGEDMVNELVNLPIYMIGGFLLTLWYDKFGIAASCVAHITNNLYSVVVTILLQYI